MQCTKRILSKWLVWKRSSIPSPQRSFDLTPLNFFFWGYIKNIVYVEKIWDIVHLWQKICSTITTVTLDMIECNTMLRKLLLSVLIINLVNSPSLVTMESFLQLMQIKYNTKGFTLFLHHRRKRIE